MPTWEPHPIGGGVKPSPDSSYTSMLTSTAPAPIATIRKLLLFPCLRGPRRPIGGRVKQNPNPYYTCLDTSAGCSPAAPNINHCYYWCQRGPRHRIDNRVKPHPESPYTSVERPTGFSPNHTKTNTLLLPARMSSTSRQRFKERRGGSRIDTYIYTGALLRIRN